MASKPALTGQALTDHWEALLKAEDLGPVKPLTRSSTKSRDGLVVVPNPQDADEAWADRVSIELHGAPMSVHSTDNAATWRAFSAAIWYLPPRFVGAKSLAFLHAYGEHAILDRAAREAGISNRTARTTLRKFLTWRQETKC